jgi:hypothetical protein
MKRTLLTGLGAGLFAALLNLNPAFAQEDHKAEATRHALAAVEAGKKGDAAAVGEHAAMAKTHAEAAEQEKANPHLEAGIKNLNEAIEHARMGHADVAGKAAEAACAHLKAAEKAF